MPSFLVSASPTGRTFILSSTAGSTSWLTNYGDSALNNLLLFCAAAGRGFGTWIWIKCTVTVIPARARCHAALRDGADRE
jgi:hypothetical protein